MMTSLEKDELVHIVERRFFADDVRRHFVGRVVSYDGDILRVVGYVWIFQNRTGKFVRRREKRERVFVLADNLIINVLPKGLTADAIVYATDNDRRMYITDTKGFALDLSEFAEIK
jgi:hypothetical protein